MATWQRLALLAAAGSAALLLGAFGFQYIGGMAPCKMCLWQRWPHAAAILIGLLILIRPTPKLAWLGFIAAMTTAGIAIYHSGVEYGWWPGPSSCTGGPVAGQSTDALFNQIMTAPLVRCDEIPWQMIGVSMAGWNGILSCLLAFLWLRAARMAPESA